MDMRSHIITIDENGIPSTISIDRATHMLTKSHMMKKLTYNFHLIVRTTVPKSSDTECKVPLEYVVENLWVIVTRQRT